MQKLFLLLSITFQYVHLHAQFTPTEWVIGQGGGNPYNNQKLIFNGGTMSVQLLNGVNNGLGKTSAAITDVSHPLLFYTNGGRVWNYLHNILQNGDSLSPCAYTFANMTYNGLQLAQMCVFIPDPGDTNKFYLFHASGDTLYQPCLNLSQGYGPNKFYYSIIDKTGDNGNGAVVSKNNIILNGLAGQGVIAIKHGNGRDWWIIVRHATQPAFISWLITPSGINQPQYQFIGPLACAGFQSLKFSALTNIVAGFRAEFSPPLIRYVDLYDFDRCTGLFSNSQTLNINNYALAIFSGGCEISPNGRYLYTGVLDELHQFDLLAPNIQASEIVVDSIDSLTYWTYKAGYYLMQLAPDGKIYCCGSSNNYLNVINHPDSTGMACNAVQMGVVLPSVHNVDLPNIPNYELGALVGSGCDTLTAIQSTPTSKEGELKIFYYSDWQKAFINAQGIKGRKCKLRIFDIMGKVVYQFKGVTNPPYFTKDVDLSFLSNGLYIVNLETEREVLSGKLVKQ